MLERFLEAGIRDFDDITDWLIDEEFDTSSGDDFMRDVSSMMDDASFE